MCDKDIEAALQNASASLRMEGFFVDECSRQLCRLLLRSEITWEEYIAHTLEKAGVSAK